MFKDDSSFAKFEKVAIKAQNEKDIDVCSKYFCSVPVNSS